MAFFQVHPDKWVNINNEASIPLSEFLIDEPSFTLPPNMTGVYYEAGVKFYYFNSDRAEPQEVLEWSEGNSYIANAQTYVEHMQERLKASLLKDKVRLEKEERAERERRTVRGTRQDNNLLEVLASFGIIIDETTGE